MANEGVSEQICNASITIFTNGILALCRENKELDCLDKQEVKSFTETLALLLVEEVANCEDSILTACLALKCLELMFSHSKSIHDILAKSKRFEILVTRAYMYGCREHLMLENTAFTLLQVLQISSFKKENLNKEK